MMDTPPFENGNEAQRVAAELGLPDWVGRLARDAFDNSYPKKKETDEKDLDDEIDDFLKNFWND